MTLHATSDEGGRQLAGHVLEAAGRGDEKTVATLLAPLDTDQLRSLVMVLAQQVDQSVPETSAGPQTVCELAIAAAAATFGVTAESIVSNERSRTVSDARAVAMTAARQQGLSLPAIGHAMNKDHASVIHAVRRTAERPRLADAAARISAHIQTRFNAVLPRPEKTADPEEAAPSLPTSAFEPTTVVQHAIAATAKEFGTTPEVLLGADRSRATGDARAVAMTAARMSGQTLTQVAREFNRDHTTVLAATRRTQKTPLLHDLAARVARDLPATAQPQMPEPIAEVTPLPSRSARAQQHSTIRQPQRSALKAAR